jgi:hypothetical protein
MGGRNNFFIYNNKGGYSGGHFDASASYHQHKLSATTLNHNYKSCLQAAFFVPVKN